MGKGNVMEEKDLTFEEVWEYLSPENPFDPWGRNRIYGIYADIQNGKVNHSIVGIKSHNDLEKNRENFTRFYMVVSARSMWDL
jgi:hypothetical protein